MTKLLAQILGDASPHFRLQLAELERASGLTGADIRLGMEVVNQTRYKMRELGLDPHDTTGPELFSALKARLQEDEKRIRDALGVVENDTPADITGLLTWHLDRLNSPSDVFAVRPSVMRSILKNLDPKNTVKKLGYRSLDSMLRQENLADVLAATTFFESNSWQRKRLDAYKKLKASDFEHRKAAFRAPRGLSWSKIGQELSERLQHGVVAVPEMGAIVLLPVDHNSACFVIANMLLAVKDFNNIRALSTWLRLSRIRRDFGRQFSRAIQQEITLQTDVIGRSMSWRSVHWLYGHTLARQSDYAFEPHLSSADFQWLDGESVLVKMHPVLEFWLNTEKLAFVVDDNAVSLNVLDVALNLSNSLNYAERTIEHLQEAIHRELLSSYCQPDSLRALVSSHLAPEYALN